MNLEDRIDLMKEYPPLVRYPLGGSFLLLIWHAQSEGQHAILASETGLLPVWKSALQRYDNEPEPREMWRVNIVTPGEPYARLLAQTALRESYRRFRQHVGSYVWAMLHSRDRAQLPDALVRCERYFNEHHNHESVTDPTDGTDDPEHASCQNCLYGYTIKDSSVEDLFLQKRSLVPADDESRLASRAPKADPTKPLFALREEFGHHRKGLYVARVEEDDCRYSHDTTFFFHGESVPLSKEVAQARAEIDNAFRLEEERRQRAFKAMRKRQNNEALEGLMRFIDPPLETSRRSLVSLLKTRTK